jgi:hypothetical protein
MLLRSWLQPPTATIDHLADTRRMAPDSVPRGSLQRNCIIIQGQVVQRSGYWLALYPAWTVRCSISWMTARLAPELHAAVPAITETKSAHNTLLEAYATLSVGDR